MRLAIVKLSALGDIVHAMVILQYIKKNIPNIIIDWFVEENFAQLLQNNPDINEIYKLKLKNNKKGLWKQYKKLKTISEKNSYDLIIDLQGLIKSAIVSKILGKSIAGFDKNSIRESIASLFYTKTFKIDYNKNVILRNLELTCRALEIDMPDISTKKAFLHFNNTSDIRPKLLIIVGSSWESKIYPKQRFIEIINALEINTYISWGNEKEYSSALFIQKHTNAKVLEKLNLDELKCIITNSALVIGSDSGPTHMAWALNVPSITIFGPTPSDRNTLKTGIHLTIDCEKKIDAKAIDKQDFCIKDIKPQKVIELAKELLEC